MADLTEKLNEEKSMGACKEETARDSTPLIPLPSTSPATAQPPTANFPFSKIRQGTATNTLTKLVDSARATQIDELGNTSSIKKGNFSVILYEFNKLAAGLRVSAYQLLDALTIVFTESGAKSPFVSLPLEKYMQIRGLKNVKETRKQVSEDLETLFNARLSFTDMRGNGQSQDYYDMRILDSKGISKGVIHASFGTSFFTLLSSYPVMPYGNSLLSLNSKKNPNSYAFYRKILELKNMNVGKPGADIISVKTLLAVAHSIPPYEEVAATKGKQIDQRIITPFERDLTAISDIGWEYCHKNGAPLSKEELDVKDYNLFISLNIKVTWNAAYPDQTARLERKEKRIKEAQKKKEKAQKEAEIKAQKKPKAGEE